MADRRVRYILEVDYDGGGAALRAADDLREVDDAARQAGDGLAQAEGGFSKFQAGIVTLSSGLNLVEQGFQTIAGAAQAAWDVMEEGAALQDMRQDFDALAVSVDSSASAMLGGMAEAAGGMMTNAEMIGAASDLIMLNLGLTEEQITSLVGVAGELEWSMDAVANAINTKSTRGLKELGLGIEDVKEKARALAEQGYSLDEAFTLAILDAGRERIELVGGASETAAGKMVIATNAVKNYTDSLKVQAVQLLENIGLFDKLAQAADSANTFINAVDAIDEAYRRGIITQQEYNELNFIARRGGTEVARAISEELTAAMDEQVRSMQWVVDQYDAYNAAQEYATRATTEGAESADRAMISYANYAMSQDEAARAAEWVADATERARAADYARAVEVAALAATQAELIALQEEWIAYTGEVTSRGGDYFSQFATGAENAWNLGDAIYNAADAAGAGIAPLADLGVELGKFDEATADAATAQAQQQIVIDNLAQAARDGKIAWEDYYTTVEKALAFLEEGYPEPQVKPNPRADELADMYGIDPAEVPGIVDLAGSQTVGMALTIHTSAALAAVQEATEAVEGFDALAPEVVAEMNILSVRNGVGVVKQLLAELPSRKEIVIDVTVTGMGIVNQLQALGALP